QYGFGDENHIVV
ncbi:phage tail fiber repeat protein, partial [Escherichia coli 3006]